MKRINLHETLSGVSREHQGDSTDDVPVRSDGALLVSDDQANIVYRTSQNQ
jgi:glucose/arabinose dehydrogenase